MPEFLRVFDKYEVIRRLASGGMGELFLARQTGVAGFSRLVVLKSLRPSVLENRMVFSQFLNEARTAAKLNHPNVVAVYEIDEYRGVYFIAMEFIKGPNVASILRRARALGQSIPFRVAASIVRHAALGLAHAHEAVDESGRSLGIAHRDVSPGNVMVRLDGLAKIVDFGIAAMVDQIDPLRHGVVQGKVRYMAPEQARGEPAGPAADQFSLGVVLWELLTRRRMVATKDPREGIQKIIAGHFPTPSSVEPRTPAELDLLTMRMLAETPDRRLPSCRAVADALQAFLHGCGGPCEDKVGRYVEALLGSEVEELTRNLTPEPVSISGMLRQAQVMCLSCSHLNSMRHRFCAACGAALDHDPAPQWTDAERSAPAMLPVSPVPSPDPAVRNLGALMEHATHLAGALARERTPYLVLAFRCNRGGPVPGADAPPPGVRVVQRPEGTLWVWKEPSGLDQGLRQAVLAARAVLTGLAEQGLQAGSAVEAGHGDPEDPEAHASVRAVQWAGWALQAAAPGPLVGPRWASLQPAGVSLQAFRSGPGEASLWVADCDGTEGPDSAELRGRDAEVAAIERSLSLLQGGLRQQVAIVGESGSGRTALLAEARRLAALRGYTCLSADPDRARPGLQFTLQIWIQDVLAALDLRPERDHWIALGLAPALADRLVGWMERPGSLEPERERAVCIRVLVEASKLRPLCLFVDDVDRVPTDLSAWLDDLTDRVREGAIAVFTTRRASASSAPLKLQPLADEQVLALLEDALDGPCPRSVAPWIVRRSQGRPKWAHALLAFARRQGLIERREGAWVSNRPLEPWMDAQLETLLVRQPYRELPPPARTFLRVAALVGRRFPIEVVLRAADLLADRAPIQAALIESRMASPVDGQLWAFEQAILQQSLAESFEPDDRRRVHRRLAQVWAVTADPAHPRTRWAVAHHLLAAEAGLEAGRAAARAMEGLGPSPTLVPWVQNAVRAYAEADGASEEELHRFAESAIRHLRPFDLEAAAQVLDAIAPRSSRDPIGRVKALRARARVLMSQGRIGPAQSDLDEALRRLGDDQLPGLKAGLLGDLAGLYEARGEWRKAAQVCLEALALADRAPGVEPDFGWSQANALGRIYLRMGDPARADQAFTDAERQAAEAGSDLGRVRALTNRAVLRAQQGRMEEAEAFLDAAQGRAETLDDGLEMARVAYNRGRILTQRRQHLRARQALQLALEQAARAGWREGEAMALSAMEALPPQASR